MIKRSDLKLEERIANDKANSDIMVARTKTAEQHGVNVEGQTECRIEQVCGAWKTVDEAAADVWSSIHKNLLYNTLVFGYKSTTPGSDLVQIVIVMNTGGNDSNKVVNDFGVGMVTSGFSMLLPHVPFNYLTETTIKDLEKYKIGKENLNNLKYILSRIEDRLNN